MGRIPTVFISSTCYDLKQIRVDLKEFIEKQLGFEAALSEYESFPIDPSIGNVENCIKAVRERADIFILIIGGRYGCIGDNGKSITNLEYLNAKAKGIPIYAFVDKKIIGLMSMWKSNPDADFSATVDSPKLFEFVEIIRGEEDIWVYDFENAQDIIKALRNQFGYLLYDALKLRHQASSHKLSAKIMALQGESLKIALEKPDGWEYFLLANIMKESFKRAQSLKKDALYGVSFNYEKSLKTFDETAEWIRGKIKQILLIMESLNALFDKVVPVAIGAPGEPGDLESVIYVAERWGRCYEEFLNWGLSFNSISVDEDWERAIYELSTAWKSPIEDFDEYCERFCKEMENIKRNPSSSESIKLELTLVIKSPDLTLYNKELEKIKFKHGLI